MILRREKQIFSISHAIAGKTFLFSEIVEHFPEENEKIFKRFLSRKALKVNSEICESHEKSQAREK